MTDTNFCTQCGTTVNPDFYFCPKCGKALKDKKTSINTKVVICFIILAAGAYGLQSFIHSNRGDKRPTEVFAGNQTGKEGGFNHASRATVEPVKDEELDRLRTDLAKSPEDLTKLRALIGRIATLMRESPDSSRVLALEAVDTLSAILKQTPDDAEALIMMADVSFDQKAFEKAAGFYERYLKIEPDDLAARARYGSTLTFVGKLDESISELKTILDKDPNNFPAHAYLSITYAEKGNDAEALRLGKRALELAPNEDAKARFGSFVDSLTPNENQPIQVKNPIVDSIKKNPIAGQKFVSFSESDSGKTLTLVFKDFPMAAMPPFAKEKFFSGIKAAGVGSTVTKVVFVDQGTGTKMEEVSLNNN